jgi:outer membrane biosynthesis protein TonB
MEGLEAKHVKTALKALKDSVITDGENPTKLPKGASIRVGKDEYPAREVVMAAAKLAGLKGASKLKAKDALDLLVTLGFEAAKDEVTEAPTKAKKPTKPKKAAKPKLPKEPVVAVPTESPKPTNGVPVQHKAAAEPVVEEGRFNVRQPAEEAAATRIRRSVAAEPIQNTGGCLTIFMMLVVLVILGIIGSF